MNYVLSFLLFVVAASAYGLELDEKLTLRIVSTSQSKKTILINRGIEDGLVKGDHAKFFVSSGVIARGVCIKLSPTRSVWSVYRKVNASFLIDEQVMKLKITPAVKITNDESRMLVTDDSSSLARDPRDLGIPLADGADDLDLSTGTPLTTSREWQGDAVSLAKRNKEVFGMINYSSYTENNSPDNTNDDYSSEVTNLLMRIGGEWYFPDQTTWYSRLSFLGTFTIDRKAVSAYNGTFLKEETSEFGFGINLYPLTLPSKPNAIVQYLNFTLGLGSTNSTYVSGDEQQITPIEETLDASVVSYAFGYGLKYYTSRGFGARLLLSYMLRGDQFAKDQGGVSWLKNRGGPRLLAGFSYRF